jgi:homoserine dehydrogenase
MSSVVALDALRPSTPRLALLGTGVVGSAFVARYQRLRERELALPALAWLANSRALHECHDAPDRALAAANAAPRRARALPPWAENEALGRGDVVVDATASDSVADWHAEWLSRGVHVVTANKLGTGATVGRAHSIAVARGASGARYGDSATVGAGLPLLRSLRALVAGGDRIHRIEGILSGSLAWLFNHYDGTRPFSALVREARAAGFTEPDPRVDLSGEDVRRKLLILARAADMTLQAEDVHVDSLVPAALASSPAEALDRDLHLLDVPLASRLRHAAQAGARLRFVARVDAQGARVGLADIDAGQPLFAGAGTDNCVAIHSDRYNSQPLLIQGPGAGAEVTAAALLDDVLRVSEH